MGLFTSNHLLTSPFFFFSLFERKGSWGEPGGQLQGTPFLLFFLNSGHCFCLPMYIQQTHNAGILEKWSNCFSHIFNLYYWLFLCYSWPILVLLMHMRNKKISLAFPLFVSPVAPIRP